MAHSATTLDVDTAVMSEMGKRLAGRRVEMGLTQAVLAREAGVSKRTVERLEHGESTQLIPYVRVLRALGLLEAWLAVHPEAGPGPMALLAEQQQAPRRRRVRSRAKASDADAGPPAAWKWGDEK